MPDPTLAEQLFAEQQRIMDRYNLIVVIRPMMDNHGVPSPELQALDKEAERLRFLIRAFGWASCVIPIAPATSALTRSRSSWPWKRRG